MADVIKAVEVAQFVKKTHELAALLRLVERGSKDAVELLVDTMNATDEDVSRKMRVQCAESLIAFQIKIAETISKDQLTRQIAEVKISGPAGNGSTALDKPKGPMIDFNNIQKV